MAARGHDQDNPFSTRPHARGRARGRAHGGAGINAQSLSLPRRPGGPGLLGNPQPHSSEQLTTAPPPQTSQQPCQPQAPHPQTPAWGRPPPQTSQQACQQQAPRPQTPAWGRPPPQTSHPQALRPQTPAWGRPPPQTSQQACQQQAPRPQTPAWGRQSGGAPSVDADPRRQGGVARGYGRGVAREPRLPPDTCQSSPRPPGISMRPDKQTELGTEVIYRRDEATAVPMSESLTALVIKDTEQPVKDAPSSSSRDSRCGVASPGLGSTARAATGAEASDGAGARTSARNGTEPGAGNGTEPGAGNGTEPGAGNGTEPGGEVGAVPRGRKRGVMEDYQLATRPLNVTQTQGTSGRPETLLVNHATVITDQDALWHQYHVDFSPDVERRDWRRSLVGDHLHSRGETVYLFNGMNLYLRHRLPQSETLELLKHPATDSNVQIGIRFTNELSPSSPAIISLLNFMLRDAFRKMGKQQFGRHYFSLDDKVHVPQHHMSVLNGYNTSILNFQAGCQIQVDVAHHVISEQTTYQLMCDLHRNTNKPVVTEAKRQLIGKIVMLTYRNKTYRVMDVDFDHSIDATFKSGDRDISFQTYFAETYGISNLEPGQPLLMMRDDKSRRRGNQATKGEEEEKWIYIPAQLCIVTGLPDDMRSNVCVMSDLSKFTRIEPGERVARVRNFLKTMNNDAHQFEQFGMRFADDLLENPSRLLPDITLTMRSTDRHANPETFNYQRHQANWRSKLQGGLKVLAPVALLSWSLVYPAQSEPVAQRFLGMLQPILTALGVDVHEPTRVVVRVNSTADYISTLRRHLTTDLTMVVTLLPTSRKELYDAIKKLCYIEHPVANQCALVNKLCGPGARSIVTNIAAQMQAKLGSELWAVKLEGGLAPPVRPYMIVGIDVYHDTVPDYNNPGNRSKHSVVGVVASFNKNATKYYTQVFDQPQGQEIAKRLSNCIINAARRFHQINKRWPQGILVYRDGVGDGMLEMSLEQEIKGQLIPALQGMCEEVRDFDPKLTFIVVKKRILQRFFKREGSNIINPLPGTVVDTGVTRPEWYDFFIVSQSVRQGTVSPTHYNVIWDEMNWSPDALQRFTYAMCHLYYNWPGTIRVPAPCMYAHKAAYLSGTSLHRPVSDQLANHSYFL